jgi:outer membrane protein assembly factor BamA
MKVSGLATLVFLIGATGSTRAAIEPPLLVQGVECRGNQSTSCEFIRSHLYLPAGTAVDEAEIRNGELRLSSLLNFESVDIRLEKGAQRNAVVVVIEVVEARHITTESNLGLSSRLDATRSVIAGRLAHQNVFGAGETLDLAMLAITPLAGEATVEDYEVHLRYADPNLLGSDSYFGIIRASWINSYSRDIHGNFSDFEGPEFDLRLGRRFGDFSYLTFGVTFRPNQQWIVGEWDFDPDEVDFEITEHDELSGFNIIYGRNSEDDLYFPTRGYSFHIGAGRDFGSGSPANRSHIQFRKTWALSGGYLTAKLGGAPSPEYRVSFEENQLFSISYGRPLKASDNLKRGRWYIEPGLSVGGLSRGGYTAENERIYEVGMKAGVRLDTAAFGIVDLYLMGSVDPRQ